ncbi:MAG: hypothetical protein RL077_4952 [Verrucomicrobiota bacterium]
MRRSFFRENLRWGVACGLASGLVGLGVGLFQQPVAALAVGSAIVPARSPVIVMVRAAGTDAVLRAETEIRDLRPLFLPTSFNATLPEPRREAGRTFLDNEILRLGSSEAGPSVARILPPVVTMSGLPLDHVRSVDMLSLDAGGLELGGFGRSAAVPSELVQQGGRLEVFSTETGQRVLAAVLALEAKPPTDQGWEPFELLAAVDRAGLAAPLVVSTTSTVEEVDIHFRNFLTKRFRIGDRLAPGFYRIVLGP